MDFKIIPPVEQNVTITMTKWEAELLRDVVGTHSPGSLGRLMPGSPLVKDLNRLGRWLSDLYGGLSELLYRKEEY